MIKEAYVSFEVAKLLKEKGFTEECEYFYDWYKESESYQICSNGGTCNNEKYPDEYSMPTHQMAMAWLREEKNIFISICNGNHCKFDKNIPSETVYYFFTITNSYGVYKEEEQCFDEFKTYEEAIEAALKYCLKNLI